ncbi:MAG: MBL fold metallo-hydrolase [Candidatus Latescibacteria bacterium]|mgnify:CR=1 FL=1|nr:MBL fold metallo-hydrolase [Candidatus Latescibacterota bacterium]MBT4140916.1 MBL fold metallo-hydrolase [Candidatus Latescibacterota bacterium]
MGEPTITAKFWGVRGSIPTPISSQSLEDKLVNLLTNIEDRDVSTPDAARAYLQSRSLFERSTIGGNTSCIDIRAGDQHIIMDCGSGMKELGWSLMQAEYGKGQGEAHILISHTHWDHLMGFPFFQPAYVPGNKFTICGCHPHLKRRFDRQHHPDNFPAPMAVMGSDVQFKKWTPDRKKRLGNITVKPFLLDHPGNSYAYRIENGSKVFVYASDGAYNDPSPKTMDRYHDFYRDADVLVFDAHFDLIESFEKSDWGHSTSFLGVDIALNAGVKQLLLFHHDPLSDDRRVAKFLKGTRRYLNHIAPNADLNVSVAYEGLSITL